MGLVVVVALSWSAMARGVTLSTVTLVSNLNRPTWAGSTPALPNHLFVLEKRGMIRVIDMANANAVSTFMDLSATGTNVVHAPTSGSDEQGLLGLAFHPDYANNRLFYVYYTTVSNASNVIARYTANVGLLTGDSSTGSVMVTMPNVESNHNGGNIVFGPDGKLYCGTGDGGGAGDVHGTFGNAQKLTDTGDNSRYLGKMLRLDVDIASPYIPSDNPNIDSSGIDLKWMYGLRNPFRWSFDRATGDLYIGDVGQNAVEEVDYIPAGTGTGRNLGWRCMEGNNCYNTPAGPNCTCGGGNLTNPVWTYAGSPRCIIGGYAYRGLEIPGEQGSYFYAEYVAGPVWSFTVVGGAATGNAQRFTFTNVTSFGEDTKGEIYIVNGTGTASGTVRRIVPLNNTKADINADGFKNQLDIDILVNVLLGIDVGDPALVNRSDVNDDGTVDSLDIQAWIDNP